MMDFVFLFLSFSAICPFFSLSLHLPRRWMMIMMMTVLSPCFHFPHELTRPFPFLFPFPFSVSTIYVNVTVN